MSECWNESNDREHVRLLPCLSWHASIQDCDCTSGLINILKELAWHILTLFYLFSRWSGSGAWLVPLRDQPEGALTDRATAHRLLHLILLHRHHQRCDRGSGWSGCQRGKLQRRLSTGPVRWGGGTCWHSPCGSPRNWAAQKLRRQRHPGHLVDTDGKHTHLSFWMKTFFTSKPRQKECWRPAWCLLNATLWDEDFWAL